MDILSTRSGGTEPESFAGRLVVAKAKAKASVSVSRAPSQSEFTQPKKRRPFHIFLIMDDNDIRDGIVSELQKMKLDVHGYMTAMEFYRDYREKLPGVLISDIRLRGMSGVELQKKLYAEKFELPIIQMAGFADSPLAVQAMCDGALEFLVRPVSAESIYAAAGRAYASYYDTDWDFTDDPTEIARSMKRLTDRESEVLDLIVTGMSSRAIGDRLDVSTKTVEAHRSRINDKMRAKDLAHLVRMVYVHREATE